MIPFVPKATLFITLGAAIIIALGGSYIFGLRAQNELLSQKIKFVREERDFSISQYTQCLSDQRLTEEASNDYQTKISSLNNQLRDIKRLRDNPSCIPVTQPSCEHNVPTPERKPSGSNGLRTEWLYDFAAEGEEYRLRLMACQDFIRKTWKRSKKELD